MRIFRLLLWVYSWSIPLMLDAQIDGLELGRYKKLDNVDTSIVEQVYVSAQKQDSSNAIDVFLVNYTSKDIIFRGSGGTLTFGFKKLNKYGEWIEGSLGTRNCLPYSLYRLPSFSFTHETYSWRVDEDKKIDTQISFSIETYDSVLTTSTVNISVSESIFWSYDGKLALYQHLSGNEDLSLKEKYRFQFSIAKRYLEINNSTKK